MTRPTRVRVGRVVFFRADVGIRLYNVRRGELQKTPSVTASPCHLPRGGRLSGERTQFAPTMSHPTPFNRLSVPRFNYGDIDGGGKWVYNYFVVVQ